MNLRYSLHQAPSKADLSSQRDAAPSRPEGRLCRIINVASGTLLDQTIDRNNNVLIASPTASATIKSWRIIPFGPGYALKTAEDVAVPRYLAPVSGGTGDGQPLTLSTFPCFWDLCKTDEYTSNDEELPRDVLEEWICTIKWPFHHSARVLDLENYGRGTNVQFRPFLEPRHERGQFWRIQFLDETPTYTPRWEGVQDNYAQSASQTSTQINMGMEDGAVYILHNLKGKTVVDQDVHSEALVHGYQFDNGRQQKWRAVNMGEGWAFKNLGNGQYLSIDRDPTNGVRVTTTEYDPALWDIQRHGYEQDQGDGVYRLRLLGTNYSLSLAECGSWKNGTQVVLWESWCGRNQLWRLERVG